MRVGFVVNPIAGMGGRVGLKGTDGKVAEALERGAEPRAPERARRAAEALAKAVPEATVLAYGDPMGESTLRAAGFDPEVVGHPNAADLNSGLAAADDDGDGDGDVAGDDRAVPGETTAADTADAVRAFLDRDVDLVVFVGGDGTAADVAEVLADTETPMLGVPAGVKVYSSVFAVSPEDAGRIVGSSERTERREVLDIDEDAYREGEVDPTLSAVAHVPVAEALQSSKQPGGGTVEALAEGVADDVRAEPGKTYVLGPGSTLGAIKAELGFEGSPIGVDVWRGGDVVVRDASEADILAELDDDPENNVVYVTPIGGQGFVFGRGNDQLSPAVLSRSEVRIVASRSKLDDLRVLRVDTDDTDLDESLRGWTRVRVGKFEERMMKVV